MFKGAATGTSRLAMYYCVLRCRSFGTAGQIPAGVGSGYLAKGYAREDQAGQVSREGVPRHEKRALRLGLLIDGHRRIVDDQPSSRGSRQSVLAPAALILAVCVGI